MLDLTDVAVHTYSLVCRFDIWKMRMENDRINLQRKIETTYAKWTKRITDGYYDTISAKKIDTSDITAKQAQQKVQQEA